MNKATKNYINKFYYNGKKILHHEYIYLRINDFYENQYNEQFSDYFYTLILVPNIEQALKEKKKIYLDFDGGFGYNHNFIIDVFNSLKNDYNKKILKNVLIIRSEDQEGLIVQIKNILGL